MESDFESKQGVVFQFNNLLPKFQSGFHFITSEGQTIFGCRIYKCILLICNEYVLLLGMITLCKEKLYISVFKFKFLNWMMTYVIIFPILSGRNSRIHDDERYRQEE